MHKRLDEFDERQRQRRNRRRKKPRRWAKAITWIIRAFVIGVVAIGFFSWYAYQTAQHVPDYYAKVLEVPSRELAESGAVFENRVLELQNSAQVEGDWQIVFTEDQINGWLAVDMPRKFPKSMPKEISKPRVSIRQDDLKFVCKFESKRLSGIVVVSADAFCTENENELGIRVHSVNSGIIPIPVKRIADHITRALRKADFPATWTEMDGDPVAIVTLPRRVTDISEERSVILTSITVEDKQIVLSGKTVAR